MSKNKRAASRARGGSKSTKIRNRPSTISKRNKDARVVDLEGKCGSNKQSSLRSSIACSAEAISEESTSPSFTAAINGSAAKAHPLAVVALRQSLAAATKSLFSRQNSSSPPANSSADAAQASASSA